MEENNEIYQESNSEFEPERNDSREFWTGFGIGVAILVILFPSIAGTMWSFIGGYTIALSLFIYLGVIIYFVYKSRQKFALGLVTALLVPVAIFGGCLASLLH